jgi:hypothetical protein
MLAAEAIACLKKSLWLSENMSGPVSCAQWINIGSAEALCTESINVRKWSMPSPENISATFLGG